MPVVLCPVYPGASVFPGRVCRRVGCRDPMLFSAWPVGCCVVVFRLLRCATLGFPASVASPAGSRTPCPMMAHAGCRPLCETGNAARCSRPTRLPHLQALVFTDPAPSGHPGLQPAPPVTLGLGFPLYRVGVLQRSSFGFWGSVCHSALRTSVLYVSLCSHGVRRRVVQSV